jgi:hypothetical protein
VLLLFGLWGFIPLFFFLIYNDTQLSCMFEKKNTNSTIVHMAQRAEVVGRTGLI